MNFQSNSKYHWRRWQWNQLVQKLKYCVPRTKESMCVGLYLVGPDDEDRIVARERNFRDYNLIAVDRDEENIKKVRTNGHVGISDNLSDIVAFWPQTLPLNFIIADFVSGLSRNIMHHWNFGLLTSFAVASTTVVAVNLQRGRDAYSSPLRELLPGVMHNNILRKRMSDTQFKRAWPLVYELLDNIELHRGKQYILDFCNMHASVALKLCNNPRQREDVAIYILTEMLNAMQPTYHSYRQRVGMPFMDSVIFYALDSKKYEQDKQFQIYVDARNSEVKPPINKENVLRKIAAARAVRTMKIQKE